MLCCFALFVCLTLLASFFHLSFKNMYTCMYLHISLCRLPLLRRLWYRLWTSSCQCLVPTSSRSNLENPPRPPGPPHRIRTPRQSNPSKVDCSCTSKVGGRRRKMVWGARINPLRGSALGSPSAPLRQVRRPPHFLTPTPLTLLPRETRVVLVQWARCG